jgi:TRAP-type C4-dicarboxylate transport system permease small subunit
VKALRRTVRGIVGIADWLCGIGLIVIVIINLIAIWMRYVQNDSISWSEELIRYVAIWMTFLGAAAASWFEEHMDMNMFADFGGPRFQAWHRALLNALIAIFAAVVLWQGTIYCIKSGMQTAPTTGLPMIYVYSSIALGGLLILIVSLMKIWDAFVPPDEVETGTKALL